MRGILVRHRFIRWSGVLVIMLAAGVTAALAAPPSSQPGEQSVAPIVGKNNTISELHFRELELGGALRMLSIQTRDNIVLSGKVDSGQKIDAHLYNVTFDQALESILTPLGLVHQRKGNFVYVYTRKEMEDLAKQQRATESAIYKLNYLTATDAGIMIKPLLSPMGQVSATAAAGTGIDSGSATGGNSYATEDALVVTDYPENLRVVAKVLKDLDVRPRQVLVEATILDVKLDESNHLGVDFNFLGGVDFDTQVVAGGSSDGGEGDSGSTQTVLPGNAGALTAKTTQDLIDHGVVNIKTDFLADFPRGGLTFGLITNNLAAFVRALEAVSDTTTIANPKVLALNKQKGEVIIGDRDGYLTSITTETETYQKVEFLETGIRLVFRPYIGENGYVRMELQPKVSSGEVRVFEAGALPSESTAEVTTNLLVKDGHTIVIGGLIKEKTIASRSQVPWLGNIPYAGTLFRKRGDTTERNEIVVLLTVHIIEDNQAYACAGEKVLEDVERIRVGARQALMPCGRERLAQSHYKRALGFIDAGLPQKALWELNMALCLNPLFYDAIICKEQLTQQKAWEANTHLIRNYIYNRVLCAEDNWIDTMGAPPCRPLKDAPDRDSTEWGEPVRRFGTGVIVEDVDVRIGEVVEPTTRPADK